MNGKSLNNIDNCLAVFQGGGCKAVAYIGAYEAAIEHGIVFSEVAGTSAGAIIAALIAAGASPKDMKDFIKTINPKKIAKLNVDTVLNIIKIFIFLVLIAILIIDACVKQCVVLSHLLFFIVVWTILLIMLYILKNKYGLNSTKELRCILNNELCRLTKHTETNYEVRFKDLYKPLSIVSADVKDQKEKVYSSSQDPEEIVAEAICASCAIPFFFRPVSNKLVDGGLLSNSPTHLFSHHPAYHRIISFQLIKVSNESENESFFTFLGNLISTIVDGAVEVQSNFGVQVEKIVIPVSHILTTEFEKLKNEDIVNQTIKSGKEATEQALIKIQAKSLNSLHSNALNEELKSYDQLYSLIATYSREKVSEVLISAPDTEWAWHIFPTLLKWLSDQAKIYVYCLEEPSNRRTINKETARQKMLESLGCKYKPIPELEANAFFIKSNKKWRGAIYNEKLDPETNFMVFDIGCYYDHEIDSVAMEAWVNKMIEKHPINEVVHKGIIQLKQENGDYIISQLKENCLMYRNAEIQYIKLSRDQLENVMFLTNKIRLYKYRQIDFIFELYEKNKDDFTCFGPAKIFMPSGTDSAIGPIVIEQKDGMDYVIEGHTRLLYAYMHNVKEINVVYVKNASKPIEMPTSGTRTIKQLIISDNKEHNYNENPNYRHIEEALRKTRDALPEPA